MSGERPPERKPSGWNDTLLANVIETNKGFAFKSAWYSDVGTPIVRVSNFTENSIDFRDLARIPDIIANEYTRYRLEENDIVIQTVGSWPSNPASVVGKCVKIPEEAVGSLLNQNAVKVIPKNGIDRLFLYYVLKSKEFSQYIVGTAQGAASQAAITLDALRAYSFLCPPLETQRHIASILGAYDDLIEVNRRRVAVLEEMARELFEEWFVHFRYPCHESHKITDAPDGPLPEGWRYDAFNSLLAHTIGGLWGSEEPTTDEDCSVRVIRGTDFPRLLNGTFSSVPQRFVAAKQLAERALNSGDIVLEASGGGKDQPVGRTIFLTDHLLGQMVGSVAPASFCRLVRAMPAAGTAEYVFCLLQRMYEDGRIEKFQKQSTGLRNLSMRALVAENVAIPDAQVIATFGRFVRPWLDLAASLRSETAVLAAARDLLLPRLISGELSVTAPERVLEAAI